MKKEERKRLNDQIVEYYKSGLKVKEIAEKLDMSKECVTARLSKIRKDDGLVRRYNTGTVGFVRRVSDDDLQKCVDDGLSPEEIAEKFNLTIGIVNLKLNRIRGDI